MRMGGRGEVHELHLWALEMGIMEWNGNYGVCHGNNRRYCKVCDNPVSTDKYLLTYCTVPVQGRVWGIRLALFRRSSTVAKTANAGSMNSELSVRGCCDSSEARLVQL